MRKDFLVERQGRSFVLYAGLLDLAHQHGLREIRTEMLAFPNPENDNTALCMATVTLVKEGQELTFTGIGDASPRNVAPAMQTCLIRMAETRAKARALRDAVNVGVSAFEELGESEDRIEPRRNYAPKRQPSFDPSAPITEGQRQAIASLCQKRNLQPPDTALMTQVSASEWIRDAQSRR